MDQDCLVNLEGQQFRSGKTREKILLQRAFVEIRER